MGFLHALRSLLPFFFWYPSACKNLIILLQPHFVLLYVGTLQSPDVATIVLPDEDLRTIRFLDDHRDTAYQPEEESSLSFVKSYGCKSLCCVAYEESLRVLSNTTYLPEALCDDHGKRELTLSFLFTK